MTIFIHVIFIYVKAHHTFGKICICIDYSTSIYSGVQCGISICIFKCSFILKWFSWFVHLNFWSTILFPISGVTSMYSQNLLPHLFLSYIRSLFQRLGSCCSAQAFSLVAVCGLLSYQHPDSRTYVSIAVACGLSCSMAYEIWVPQPGFEFMSLALAGKFLTTKEVPPWSFFFSKPNLLIYNLQPVKMQNIISHPELPTCLSVVPEVCFRITFCTSDPVFLIGPFFVAWEKAYFKYSWNTN